MLQRREPIGLCGEQPTTYVKNLSRPALRRNQHLALRPGTNQLQFWQNGEAQWLFVQMSLLSFLLLPPSLSTPSPLPSLPLHPPSQPFAPLLLFWTASPFCPPPSLLLPPLEPSSSPDSKSVAMKSQAISRPPDVQHI